MFVVGAIGLVINVIALLLLRARGELAQRGERPHEVLQRLQRIAAVVSGHGHVAGHR